MLYCGENKSSFSSPFYFVLCFFSLHLVLNVGEMNVVEVFFYSILTVLQKFVFIVNTEYCYVLKKPKNSPMHS